MASLENVSALTDDEVVQLSPMKAKPKAKGKAKNAPKAKPSAGSKGMKRPAASGVATETEEGEEEEVLVKKRPAANLKRPALEPKPKKAYKYMYHKDGKWGIKDYLKKEVMTVRILAFRPVQLCPEVKPLAGISSEKLETMAVPASNFGFQ